MSFSFKESNSALHLIYFDQNFTNFVLVIQQDSLKQEALELR